MPMQLIYTSHAATDIDEDTLQDILATARDNNAGMGVSGMLLYVDGSFIQVLEGDADTVEALLNRISYDNRHGEVNLVLRREVEERVFEDWSMGYARVSYADAVKVPGFQDFFAPGFKVKHMGLDDDRINAVLKGFREGRWR